VYLRNFRRCEFAAKGKQGAARPRRSHRDLGEGGKLFRDYCAASHRTAVRGGALAFTGRNAPALTDMSAALIAGVVRWGPGTMPAFPEPVMSDQQLSSVVLTSGSSSTRPIPEAILSNTMVRFQKDWRPSLPC